MLQKNTSSLDYVFLWVMQPPYSKNPVLNVKEVYFKLSHMSCCLLHRRLAFRVSPVNKFLKILKSIP